MNNEFFVPILQLIVDNEEMLERYCKFLDGYDDDSDSEYENFINCLDRIHIKGFKETNKQLRLLKKKKLISADGEVKDTNYESIYYETMRITLKGMFYLYVFKK
jgi:hypothetical protein